MDQNPPLEWRRCLAIMLAFDFLHQQQLQMQLLLFHFVKDDDDLMMEADLEQPPISDLDWGIFALISMSPQDSWPLLMGRRARNALGIRLHNCMWSIRDSSYGVYEKQVKGDWERAWNRGHHKYVNCMRVRTAVSEHSSAIRIDVYHHQRCFQWQTWLGDEN